MSVSAAWRERIMFYRSAANIRLLPAGLYVALAACDIQVLEHHYAAGLWSLLSLAVAINWIARVRMRTPRRAVSWNERYMPLPDFLQHEKIRVEVKIVPGTNASARVRGRLLSPVVLVSTRTALGWEANPRARDVQWAHECAHIGMGDAFVYYMVSSAVGVSLLNQLIGNWRSPSNEIILAAMALIALASVRGYCRTRELTADSISAGLLDQAREELARSRILDANQLPFARTHPTFRERLTVLEDPIAMLNGATFFYFASGFMAVSVAIALHRVLQEWDTGESSVFASLAIVALTIGSVASRHVAMSSMLLSAQRCAELLVMLSIGELSSLVMHDPALLRTRHLVAVAGWPILGAILAALMCRLASLGAGFFATIVNATPDSLFRALPRLRLVTGALVAAVWIIPWFV